MRAPYGAVTAVLSLLLSFLMLSGCSGTRAAYKAADGLTEQAYVMGEHYYASVRLVNSLNEQGQLSESQLVKLQNAVWDSRPKVVAMLNAAAAFDAVESADTEDALAIALTDAALALSALIDAIKGIAADGAVGSVDWPDLTYAGELT